MIRDQFFRVYLLKGILLLLTILNIQHTLLPLPCCTFPLHYCESTDKENKFLDKPVGERRRVLRKEEKVGRDLQPGRVTKGELGEMLGWFLQVRDPSDVDLKGWRSSGGLLH